MPSIRPSSDLRNKYAEISQLIDEGVDAMRKKNGG